MLLSQSAWPYAMDRLQCIPPINTPRPVSEQRETPGNETLSCGARYHG